MSRRNCAKVLDLGYVFLKLNNMKYIHLNLFLVFCLYAQVIQAEVDTFQTTHFSGSGNCIECHDNLTDTSGQNVSIVSDWSNSMMANASKDPFWRAKVASELQRNPHLATVINDKCTQCHAPMANYEIVENQGEDIEIFGSGGVLDTNHAMHDAALNGVSCTLCHQISDDASLGTLDGFSGHYKINNSKTIYGQFDNVSINPMFNNTGYTPTYGAHISTSEMCATCHELSTPFVDANGDIVSTTPDTEFPEQTPYTEWENSDFHDAGDTPSSCQDCHMPTTTSKVSNRPNSLAAREGFAKHHFVGANTTMLTLLRDNAEELGVTSTNLNTSISRARSMLQESVTLEIVSANVTEGILEVKLKLTNNSGHKTPTSYPSRRMWLNFQVFDDSNNIVFESGAINADGSIAEADNDSDQSQVEPHHNLISSSSQVQIYEAIMGNTDDATTYTLLRAAKYLKDNRLTPKGFDKLSVPAKVGVYGDAASDDNFNLGSDEVIYRFPVAAAEELAINVALNYQTIMHGHIQDLSKDNSLPEVQSFLAMYQQQSLKHETIASLETTITDTDKDGTDNSLDVDDDNDGLLDSYEVANALNPLDEADALLDKDGDGFSNLEEFEAGTAANDASDYPRSGAWRSILPLILNQ